MDRNLFLFIIWNTAYYKKDEIISDIRESFIVHKIVEVEWSADKFSENLSRFYGKKLPKNSFKEKACGIGPFILVVVEDEKPEYKLRKTSRGEDELVNTHAFDKKTLYRKWTQETKRTHSRIHGTNTPEETEHDLTLLLGMSPEDFMRNPDVIPDRLKSDIIGSDGWKSLTELFYVLNHTCKYVVMRNYEGLPDKIEINEHTDIDVLTENYEDIVRICNAKKVFRKKYRVQCLCQIGDAKAQFDFRYVGDGYYSAEWERNILEERVLVNGIYVPCREDFRYMLLYHALIQKRNVAEDYKGKLAALFGNSDWTIETLSSFLEEKKYDYVEPSDLSVYYKYHELKLKASCKRRVRMAVLNFLSAAKRMIIGG